MGFHGNTWMLVTLVLILGYQSSAKFDKSLYCSICRAVVEEIIIRISESDPNRKVKVTSFRMGANGKKHVVEKPYARSNEHLSKIFAEVCDTMKDYGLRQLPNRKLTIIRIRSRSGQDLNIDAGATENIQNTFKGYCTALIDESEDDMWTLFKLEDLHTIESELCGKLAGMCTEEDLNQPFSDLMETEYYAQYTTFSRGYQEQPEEIYAMDGEEYGDEKVIPPVDHSNRQDRMDEL
ncbi:protein canopy homolog 2-like [Babylonia areolata]|uniref:protein canopy homolog 2-like n=1 Tax=Babylonia areolata TaxID=304850 RepID=UPI003FD08BDC